MLNSEGITMKRLVLIGLLSLLVGNCWAQQTFELEDPAATLQEDIKHAEEAVLQQEELYGVYHLKNSDYLKLFVGNYIHGFKEFDTTVTAVDSSVTVGVYYDPSEQDKNRAEQLAKRFREQLPVMFEELTYKWADTVYIKVNVHSRDRSKGY